MGFKSSVAIAQTTRFKRKLYSSQNRNSNPFTPPATPFNNTSFLIQLQQRREQGRSTPTSLRFDQYGSMENMIACCSFATSTTSPQLNHPQPPTSGPSTSQSSNLISSSPKADSPHALQLNSNPDGSQTCDSGPQQLTFCSDDASSGIRPTLELADEGDGMLRHRHLHRHLQCFMDDNFDTQCADSGSQTGTCMRKE